MKTLVKLVLVIIFTTSIFSCQETDSVSVVEARPYAEVYAEDTLKIRQFMESHYVTVDADFNTTFTQIPVGGTQTPISEMSNLEHVERNIHDITYKIYYLKLREGQGENTTPVDSSFVSYKGLTFTKTTTNNVDTYTQNVFDQSDIPVWFALEDVIRGWGEIIPQFKTGTYSTNPDGTVAFQNYGAGVMFLPSGLGYFNSSTANISSYTPLIFNFKLYSQRTRDHDRDQIPSRFEYGPNFNETALDTDGDKLPDYRDVDDDADGVLTKVEIAFTYMDGTTQKTKYYPYDGAVVDNPLTPYDERKGIPRKFTGDRPNIDLPESPTNLPTPQDSDFTATDRLRRHLDKTCKPPYTN